MGYGAADGFYFKRTTPDVGVSGRPELPAAVADQLRSKPVLVDVLAVGPITSQQLSWGACKIQRDLWLNASQADGLATGLELRPVGNGRSYDGITLDIEDGRGRRAKWSDIVDENCQFEPDQIPEAGWQYSTGAFDPNAQVEPPPGCSD